MRYKNISGYKDKIEKLIYDKNGMIVEGDITSSTSKIKVKCNNDHIFNTTATKIQQGRWCSYCRKVSFSEVEDFVKNKNGQVTGNFKNLQSRLNFMCGEGHTWITSASHILLQNTWCPTCAGTSRLDISWFDKIAESYDGKCLSKNYKTQQDKLEFVCKNNHHWLAYAKHIRAGHWCPNCHINVGEEICRKIFEDIFGEKFPKFKPEWLKNKYGYNLELDGYSQNLGIAFEHQGKQHYGIDIFNCGKESLKRISENDECKRVLCKQNNIKLIEIPQIFDLIKPKNIPFYLSQKFDEYGIVNYSPDKLNKMKISRRKYVFY